MRATGLIAMLLFISGCGSHYVIPATSSAPERIISSGYTASGCFSNLADQASKDGCELKDVKMDTSGVWMGTLLFPFVKGYTCVADALPVSNRPSTK